MQYFASLKINNYDSINLFLFINFNLYKNYYSGLELPRFKIKNNFCENSIKQYFIINKKFSLCLF
jgi:hypothetical protein